MTLVVKAAPAFAATKSVRYCSVGVVAPNEPAASRCLRFGRLQSKLEEPGLKIPSSFYASDCLPIW